MNARTEFWRKLVAEFYSSKQTQRSFAETHGVSLSTFRYWLQRHSREALGAADNEASTKLAPGTPEHQDRTQDALSSIQRLEVRLERVEALPDVLDEARQVLDQIKGLAEEIEELRQDTILRTHHLEATEYAMSETFPDDQLLSTEEAIAQLAKRLDILENHLELRFTKFEQSIRTEAASLFNKYSMAAQSNLDKVYDYLSLTPADVLETDYLYPDFGPSDLEEEFNLEDQADRLLVASLLSDPRFSETLLLEDFDERLTTIEGVWQGIEETVPPRLRRLERAIARGRTSSALQQTEIRIAYAQEHGPMLAKLDLSLPMSAEELCASLRNQEECCLLGVPTAREIINHLQVRKVLVLQGPPGTGKSRLARNLARTLLDSSDGRSTFSLVPMHPELSHQDFIGGPRPFIENGKNYGFGPHLGHLAQAVLAAIETQGRHWLILDEINRGDISALMSPVLDGLNVGALGHDYLFMRRSDPRGILPIPGAFRIIGTMNTFDEDQLFKFSEALTRRVGFVYLPPLSQADEDFLADRLIKEIAQRAVSPTQFGQGHNMLNARAHLFAVVGRVRSLANREPRHVFRFCEIGSGIVLDTLKHVCLGMLDSNKGKKIEEAVDLAVSSIFLSHLVNRDIELLEALRETVFTDDHFKHCKQRLEERIKELQVF
jgi:transposase-like protein/energy-coupling factor transporter ATP-binding protein EcfA2